MEKKNKLIYASAILIALGFGFYLGNITEAKKHMNPQNIYKTKKGERAELIDDFLYPLFSYDKKTYYFYNLPEDTQKRLMRERINYYGKVNDILKAVVAQHKVSKDKSKENKEEKILGLRELPDLATFYHYLVTDTEVQEIYDRNKSKFGAKHDPDRTMLEIRIQLLMKRILSETESTVSKLQKEEKYHFENRDPFLPLKWLDFANSPTKSKGRNPALEVHVVMGYGCENCLELGEELQILLKEYDPAQISVTMLHTSNSFLGKTYYLNKAALCVHDQDKDLYWDFNFALLKRNQEIRVLKVDDLDKTKAIFESEIKKPSFSKIDRKKFDECVKEERRDKDDKYLSPIASEMRKISYDMKFLSGLGEPVVLINGRRLDPELKISKAIKTGITNGWFQIK